MSSRELIATGHLKLTHFFHTHTAVSTNTHLRPALVRSTWLTARDRYAVDSPAYYLHTMCWQRAQEVEQRGIPAFEPNVITSKFQEQTVTTCSKKVWHVEKPLKNQRRHERGGRGAHVLWADTVIKASKRSLITINVLRHTAAEWLQAQTKWIETSSLNHIHHRAKTLARNSCVPLRLPYYPPHCQRCSGEDRRQMNLV